jgi:hypothetical protein
MQYYDWKTFGMKTFGRFKCRCESNNKICDKQKHFQGSCRILMWPRKGFSGGFLWILSWTYRFYRDWEFHGCLKDCKLLYELCSLELTIFKSSDGIKGLGIHLVQKQNMNLWSTRFLSGDQRLSVASRRTIFSGRLEGLKAVTMEISFLESDAVKYSLKMESVPPKGQHISTRIHGVSLRGH